MSRSIKDTKHDIFIHSLPGSIWTAFTDLEPVPD